MEREPLVMFCYADIGAQLRGKGFPFRLLKKKLAEGIGWTPTNIMITALGPIADTPWESRGDLIMMPDAATEVRVEFGDETPAEHFYLSDILETNLEPWSCCPRQYLKTVLAALREAGIVPHVAFEHEFVYDGANERPGDGYALDAVRRHGAFGETYLRALAQAGIEADSYLPEYGPGQFEVTYPPSDALTACDRAVILRELGRATAWRLGHGISFAPVVSAEGLGNGVHIHMSLRDPAAKPITYDAQRPFGLSEVAGRFIAGILRHMPALCAVTAPTPPSYLRLVPHRWSAAYNNLGYRDREAGVRICPVFDAWAAKAEEQFNFEFRAADASANPYLQVAIILRAGLQGVLDQLPQPEPTEDDPERMDPNERTRRGIARLPTSLPEALAALDADATACGWLPGPLLDVYRRYKRSELEITKDWSPEELCARYRTAY